MSNDVVDSHLQLVRRLAAYLPVTLTRAILSHRLPASGRPRSLAAATLFSDISGFTAMSEELASDGPRGAEEVNRVLLQTFTAMIEIIHRLGGAVSHFYGDAMSVYFPDEDGAAATRALSCAQQMQRVMATQFARVDTNRPPHKDPFFTLTIKIGVGYGRCQELVVGDPAATLEFVLTGTAVDEAAAAEKKAKAGDVIASRAVLEEAGLAATADFQPLTEPLPEPPSSPLLRWDHYPEKAWEQLGETAVSFLPAALYERLTTGAAAFLAEHRPVTSLFVQFDYAGDLDETSTIETAAMGQQLQQYYTWACDVVARFGSRNGRVNRILTGDKGNQLHIMFGAPVAPDAPEQALRCALALQREQPPFIAGQRIGVAAGKVFAGPVGSDTRREYTVVGDVVNLSARLMQICRRGQVLTDVTTSQRAGDGLRFQTLSPVQLKGKQETVIPYRVEEERATDTQIEAYFSEAERPLRGREEELDLLWGGLDIARRGVGGAAAIRGEVGAGKTHLLGAGVRYWLDEADGTAVLGVCHPHTADTPYAAWRHVWATLFNLTPEMDAAAQAARVAARTRTWLPDAGEDVRLWGEVLGLPMPLGEGLASLTAEARQTRFFNLVLRLLRALAGQRPLLIALENLQWADRSTLALLDHLTAHLQETAVFIAFTYRPNELTASLETLERPACIHIPLGDLAPDHARRLLHDLIGAEALPVAIEQQLGLRDREGRDSVANPLFLQEALNVMIATGVLQINGQVEVDETSLAQMTVPDTIHGLLLARLDRLMPDSRDLLQVASVIGRQFALEPLHHITPERPRRQVSGLLQSLTDEEMTRLISADPELTYIFQHVMTHEVAYESLPYARRQTLHAGLAEWLEQRYADNLKPIRAVLAYHFSRAARHEEALGYAFTAAQEAQAIFANGEAVDLYTLAETHLEALGVDEHWETAVELYLSRSDVRIIIGDLNNAAADAETALEIASRYRARSLMGRAYNLRAEIEYRMGHYEITQQLTGEVIENFATAVSSDQLARAYIWAGWAASSRREFEKALSHLEAARKICTETQNNYRLALALEAIGYTYYSQQQRRAALEAMKQSVQLSRKFSTPVNVGFSLNNVAFLQFETGRAKEALQTFNEAVSISRETSRNLQAIALYNRAAVEAYLGRFADAHADFTEAVGLLNVEEHARQLVEAYLYWGQDYSSALGDWEDARLRFTRAEELIQLQPDNYPEEKARLLLGLGQVELHDGSLEAADSYLQQARTQIETTGLSWWSPAYHHLMGQLLLSRSLHPQAEETLLAGQAAITEKGGCPDYLAPILLALAQVTEEMTSKLAYAEKCIAVARQRARFVDKVNCLAGAGKLLLDSGRPDHRQTGREAVQTASMLGESGKEIENKTDIFSRFH